MNSLLRLAAVWMLIAPGLLRAESVVYPAPEGEPLSLLYTASVDGKNLPVYKIKVAHSDPVRRFRNVDDVAHSGEFFEEAAFAYFDTAGRAQIKIVCPQKVQSAKILPRSAGITPKVEDNTITVDVAGTSLLTLEINGSPLNALHLFANPPEENAPTASGPGVIYYGPGIHEVDDVHVPSNTTVYIAGGAVVRGKFDPAKPKGTTFHLEGDHIQFRGRGILDGSLSPIHSRHLLFVKGNDIKLEGVILRDSSVWTIPVRQSSQVEISNLKLLCYRANSDGIDICNSTDVHVTGCFIRTLDDLIVVKSDKGQGRCGNIVAEKCVLWNEVAHALSVGAELREDIDNVVFRNCDIIHDMGREWTLRVFHCDAARISNIRFEDLRVEESKRLISVWIGPAVWSRDSERGHIDGVVFSNIDAKGPCKIELKGFDAEHLVENVKLKNIMINGQPLKSSDVLANRSVKNVTVSPVAPGDDGKITVKDF